VPFECHRFDGSPAVGPDSHVELYLGNGFDDLLVFDLGSTTAWPGEEGLRNLLWSIVGGALIRRGYAARPTLRRD
jgi:hypothetical protein